MRRAVLRIDAYRFTEVRERGIPLMFIDSILPRHYRMNFAIVGDTASENPDFQPILREPHKFQIGMVNAPPGCGPAYHTHDYIELFFVLTGREGQAPVRVYHYEDRTGKLGGPLRLPLNLTAEILSKGL